MDPGGGRLIAYGEPAEPVDSSVEEDVASDPPTDQGNCQACGKNDFVYNDKGVARCSNCKVDLNKDGKIQCPECGAFALKEVEGSFSCVSCHNSMSLNKVIRMIYSRNAAQARRRQGRGLA